MSDFVEILQNPDKILNSNEVSECAPGIKTIETGICSTNEMINKFKSWLENQGIIIAVNAKPSEVIKAVEEKTDCKSESCAVAIVIPQSLEVRFNSSGPWNSTNWLSNNNIDRVLELYWNVMPKFIPIPFQMRDFAKQPNSKLANFNWESAKKTGVNYIACALNTDWTYGKGEHWVSFFVDFPGKTVEYFDSAGQTPHSEFIQLLVDVASKLEFKDECITTVVHQTENTECGMYTLFYILSRLHGIPFKKFRGRRIPDDVMVAFRKFVFRHSS